MNHILHITKHAGSKWYDLIFKYINKNMKSNTVKGPTRAYKLGDLNKLVTGLQEIWPRTPFTYGPYNLGLPSSNFWRPIPLIISETAVKFAT